MSFELIGYIDISSNRQGVMYPIYNRVISETQKVGPNFPYFQIVDGQYKITSFVPFYDTENYVFFGSKLKLSRNIGDDCLLAFYNHKSELVELQLSELRGHIVDMDPEDFEVLPVMTKLFLGRIVGKSLTSIRDLSVEFSRVYLKSENSREVFVRAKTQTYHNEDRIWRAIKANEPNINALFNPNKFFGTMDREALYVWLISNSSDNRWPFGWINYMERSIDSDGSGYLVGCNWVMSAYPDFELKTPISRFIVIELINRSRPHLIDRDLCEYILESIESGAIDILFPALKIRSLIQFLNYGNKIVEFNLNKILFEILAKWRLPQSELVEVLNSLPNKKELGETLSSENERKVILDGIQSSLHLRMLRDDSEVNQLLQNAISVLRADM